MVHSRSSRIICEIRLQNHHNRVVLLFVGCSYDLVRLLQRRVHGSVGRLIDTKLEERVLEGDGHSVVAQITEDVLNSAE